MAGVEREGDAAVTEIASVYKVLLPDEWLELRRSGRFSGSTDDLADGFVHLSTRPQLAGTLERHFGAAAEVVIVRLALAPESAGLRWEPSRRGELFPHLYRALTRADVDAHWLVRREPADGGGADRIFPLEGVIPQ